MIGLKILLLVVGSYLLGSVNGSIALSKLLGRDDVRGHGSGNAGATNMARVYGLSAGLLTLAFDILKALLVAWLAERLLGDVGLAIGGLACLLGHCFPVFHNFKGGKGIAVGAALGYAIDWRVLLAIALVFFIVAFASKKVSLGSVCAAVTVTIASLVFGVSTPKLILAVCGMCIVLFQHRENIKRLLRGTEPDFKAAGTRDEK